MVRNILNELTARGVRHLIISALFFRGLCSLWHGNHANPSCSLSTVIYREKASLSFSTAWLLGGLLVLKTLSNAIADYEQAFCRI